MKLSNTFRVCDFCGKHKGYNSVDHSECSKKLQEARTIKNIGNTKSKYALNINRINL
jgi:hypothetical protein